MTVSLRSGNLHTVRAKRDGPWTIPFQFSEAEVSMPTMKLAETAKRNTLGYWLRR